MLVPSFFAPLLRPFFHKKGRQDSNKLGKRKIGALHHARLTVKSHFRQLGNQKETLMVEIPTVASPSRLFGVLYQQHLSKIF